MRTTIYLVLILSILSVIGCANSTVLLYQCADGTIVDNIEKCPELPSEKENTDKITGMAIREEGVR